VKAILAVAAGGALGSVLRFLVGDALLKASAGAIGYGTLAVNVTGSLALGFLARFWAPPHGSHTVFLALTVGLCGGYTTFSTFSLDLFVLAERGEVNKALLNALATVVLSYGALVIGYTAAKVLRPVG
jgi:CrcB protein